MCMHIFGEMYGVYRVCANAEVFCRVDFLLSYSFVKWVSGDDHRQ